MSDRRHFGQQVLPDGGKPVNVFARARASGELGLSMGAKDTVESRYWGYVYTSFPRLQYRSIVFRN